MKINVTVDLSDFYMEEDNNSFSKEIKDYISSQVKREILEDWSKKISEEFNKAVFAEVDKQKDSFITNTVNELIHNAKVKKRYSTNELISFSDFVIDEIQRNNLSSSNIDSMIRTRTGEISEDIKRQAAKISVELKERYDLLFASQIVSKLNEHGMLKENVAQLLLNPRKNE